MRGKLTSSQFLGPGTDFAMESSGGSRRTQVKADACCETQRAEKNM